MKPLSSAGGVSQNTKCPLKKIKIICCNNNIICKALAFIFCGVYNVYVFGRFQNFLGEFDMSHDYDFYAEELAYFGWDEINAEEAEAEAAADAAAEAAGEYAGVMFQTPDFSY